MPKGIGERKYMVVAREDVSGWPEARALRRATAQAVAEFLREDVFARHGCPTTIVVDGGSENKGVVEDVCELYSVKKHTVTAYHPQANGVVERGHKQLVDGLSKACAGDSIRKWPDHLISVLWADRITVRKSTKFSPFELVYGRKCLLPIDVIFSTWQIVQDYEKWLPMTMEELLDLQIKQLGQNNHTKKAAIENLKASRLKNKEYFDKNKRLRPETAIISKKDLVLLHDTKLENQHTDKLADKWGGPYIVQEILDGGAYVLADLDGTKVGAYAGNRLKKSWRREEVESVP